jgi:hypothetical protein
MLEKLCSGEDVTDDDEPSSCWTISEELALARALSLSLSLSVRVSLFKRSRKRPPFSEWTAREHLRFLLSSPLLFYAEKQQSEE